MTMLITISDDTEINEFNLEYSVISNTVTTTIQ